MKKITTVYSQYVFFGTDQESVERGGGGGGGGYPHIKTKLRNNSFARISHESLKIKKPTKTFSRVGGGGGGMVRVLCRAPPPPPLYPSLLIQ